MVQIRAGPRSKGGMCGMAISGSGETAFATPEGIDPQPQILQQRCENMVEVFWEPWTND